MPRGMNPNSQKALKQNRAKGQFSGETAVKAQEKAAAVQRANGIMKQAFIDGVSDDDARAIVKSHVQKARHGNEASTRLIIEMLGEKPKDQVEISGSASNPFSGLTTEELRQIIKNES